MTGHRESSEKDVAELAALAELPGWTELVAAGRVAAPPERAVAAAVAAVRAAPTFGPDAGTVGGASAATGTRSAPAVAGRGWRRRGLAGAVAAGVLAAALVLVPVVTGPDGASAEAAQVLDQAAVAALGHVPADAAARPDQYWRITTRGTAMLQVHAESTTGYLVSQRRVEYVAVDGRRPTWFVSDPPTAIRQVSGVPGTPPPDFGQQREVWTMNLAPQDIPPGWQVPTPEFLAALPRDPEALRERLYRDSADRGRSADGEVLVYVNDVLRSGLVPADLRSALYRVLRTVPGVEVTATRTAIDGRTGIGLGRLESVDDERQEIIIDPASGEFIGERHVLTEERDGVPAGTETNVSTVDRVLVDAVPADITASARRDTCTVTGDGAVECQRQQ